MTTPITTDAYNVAYAERHSPWSDDPKPVGYYVQRLLDKRDAATAQLRVERDEAVRAIDNAHAALKGFKFEDWLATPREELLAHAITAIRANAEQLREENERLKADLEKADQQEQLVADALPAEFEGCEETFGWMVNAVVQERDALRAELATMREENERLTKERDEAKAETSRWMRSFDGHVYVKNEDYAELATLRARLDAQRKATQGLMTYRQHAKGCAIDQTDFCTCGMKEATERARAALNQPESEAKP